MKTVKKTKKNTKPAFVVDITECEDANDMLIEFGYTKQAAGLPITTDELEAIINEAIDFAEVCLTVNNVLFCEQKPKKLPWYKRAWNWLRGKK